MAALLTFNWQPMQAQSCIDFEVIDETLANLPDHCNCSNFLEWGEAEETTYFSSLSVGTSVSNECIKVFGELILDAEIVFDNCNFLMDAGASLKVDNEIIEIKNSTFQSCGNYLWSGIKILDFKNLRFLNNVLSDSYSGIYSDTVSYLIAVDNVFNNNYKAIQIGSKDNFVRLSTLFLQGNLFSVSSGLKDHWDPEKTINENLAEGVFAINADVNADASNDACEERNIFYKLQSGFFLVNCMSSIKANIFKDFFSEIGGNSGGITSMKTKNDINSVLIQEGWPTSHEASFDNVPTAISTFNTETIIRNNEMKEVLRGIVQFRPRVRNIIRFNNIQASNVGIEITDNLADFFRVNNNNITLYTESPFSGRGIEIAATSIEEQNALVECNTILLAPASFGILLKNVEGLDVYRNTVNIQNVPNSVWGIEVRGGGKNDIRHNQVSGSTDPSGTFKEANGIKISGSKANLLQVNETDEMEYGFHFSGDNFNTVQDRNRMNDHRVGYYFDYSAITGRQFFVGNQWLGTYDHRGALHLGPHNGSQHRIYSNQTGTVFEPPSVTPPQWFDDLLIGSHTSINPDQCYSLYLAAVRTEAITGLDSLIAQDSLNPEDFTQRRKWNAERFLYQKLKENPSLITGSLFQNFMNSHQSSDVGAYFEINYLLDSLWSIPSSMNNDLMQQDTAYHTLKDTAHQLYLDWDFHPDSTHYPDQINSLYGQMDSIWAITNGWYDNWYSGLEGEVNSLLTHAGSLDTPNVYAVSERLVLKGEIHAILHPDSIPSGLLSQIETLAMECALEYGPAVHRAGALMNYFGESLITEDVYCEDTESARIGNPFMDEISKFQVYPNPTAGVLHVNFENYKDLSGTFHLYSTNGKFLKKWTVDKLREGEITLDLNGFPQGSYLLHWSDGTGSHTEKVSIIR